MARQGKPRLKTIPVLVLALVSVVCLHDGEAAPKATYGARPGESSLTCRIAVKIVCNLAPSHAAGVPGKSADIFAINRD